MRFESFQPCTTLKPYIKQYVISENEQATQYKVLPSMGLVMGFQYRGELNIVSMDGSNKLSASGITGMKDSFQFFSNTAGIGTVLVYFTEIGFAHFSAHPAHELFNQSLSLNQLFSKTQVAETEEKLAAATTDVRRIKLVEQFLLSQLRDLERDKLIVEAVKLIYASGGTIKIKDLNQQLYISQSPFEKRFRKLVGTSPKKFASIIRFNTVLNSLNSTKSLTEICYEHNFFDQAHFIKEFRQFTGETPDAYKRLL